MAQASVEQSGAFVESFTLQPAASGPLSGLRFAVKDLIDTAGHLSGCGNPTWRATHPPAATNAVCVDQILAAGATCVGKTVSDELAFGINGENAFYGTPLNPRAPDRVPGGSSSGSASAVACELADFALGTDTGGSVRAPGSYCGIFGYRPSHDRVSLAGVMPFAPSLDTVGVLASSARVLAGAASVLLGVDLPEHVDVGAFHMLKDAWDVVDDDVREGLRGGVAIHPGQTVETSMRDITGEPGLDIWYETHRVVQWAEIWSTLGPWVEQTNPDFGPRTAVNFNLVRNLDRSLVQEAVRERERLFEAMSRLLGPTDVLCMPTTPTLAPIKGSLPIDRTRGNYFPRTISFMTIAGVARLPQITLPFGSVGGVPIGLSLIGGYRQDAFLLALAVAAASLYDASKETS